MGGTELMMLGAAAGALTNPKDPLTSAMLGGMAGAAGGALMGPAAVPAALGSTGATAAGTASLTSPTMAAGYGLVPATTSATGLTAPAMTSGLGFMPANVGMTAGTAALQAPSTMIAPSLGTAAAPGFGQQALNFMNQNPVLTNQGFNLANNMMQEEPTQYAPPGQVSRGGPIQANDYMSLLAPQQSPVIMPQRLSLI
jgi:hypothetical protein